MSKINIFKRAKHIFNPHQTLKMPHKLVVRRNWIIGVILGSSLILRLSSFCLQWANDAFDSEMFDLAILLLAIYFLKSVLEASFQTFQDALTDGFTETSNSFLYDTIIKISNQTRGKVYVSKKGSDYKIRLTNSEIITQLKEYISGSWIFLRTYPIAIFDIIVCISMTVAVFANEYNKSPETSFILGLLLVIAVILYILFSYLRIKIHKNSKKEIENAKKARESSFNDILNMEPTCNKEFEFHARTFIEHQTIIDSKRRSENKKSNIVFIVRSLIFGFFMIAIMIIELLTKEFSKEVILSITALAAVYTEILMGISSILRKIEEMVNILNDLEIIQPDVQEILRVYELEENNSEKLTHNQKQTGRITLNVNPFCMSYNGGSSVYSLSSRASLSLQSGNSYLLYGETGCGKSTFSHILTGRYKTEAIREFIPSIMMETSGSLGESNPVLNELIFSNDYSLLDLNKLVELLKGTAMYSAIERKIGKKCSDEDIIEHLKRSNIKEFSQGQQKRLAIVKILYNMDSSDRLLVFDEATSALDDATARQVLAFINEFAQRESSRILVFASHQLNLFDKSYKKITFVQKRGFSEYEVVTEF